MSLSRFPFLISARFGLLCALAMLSALAPMVANAGNATPDAPLHAPNATHDRPDGLDSPGLPARLVVRLKPGHEGGASGGPGRRPTDRPLSPQALSALSGAAGWPLDYIRPLSDGAHVLAASHAGAPLAHELAAALRRHASVERAEPDQPMVPQLGPDAQELTRLWNLKPVVSGSVGTDFEAAWLRATGRANVIVAVLDTGVLAHPDLVGQGGSVSPPTGALASVGYDFISDCRIRGSCPSGTPVRQSGAAPTPGALDRGDWISEEDQAYPVFSGCRRKTSSWHGTHVAGIVAALADAQGVVGAAWGVRLLPVRVLGKCGGYMSDVAEALRWAAGVHPSIANPTPARVLNVSLGSQLGCSATMQSAIDAARAAGAVVVAAAGNASGDAARSSVAGCEGVIAVAASTRAGDLAGYSNRSTTHVALSAPGGDGRSFGSQVLSTMNTGTTAHDPSGWRHAERSGTSFAAPHVAAAAALLLSRDPSLRPEAVRSALTAPGAVTAFAPAGTCGTTGACGSGILHAARSLAMADGRLSAQADTLDFGHPAFGERRVRRIEATNPGLGSVQLGLVRVVESAGPAGASSLPTPPGTDVPGFAIVQDGCAGRTLAPAALCAVDVAFVAGTAPGVSRASLVFGAAPDEVPLLAVALLASVGSNLAAPPDRRLLPALAPGEAVSVDLEFTNAAEASQVVQALRVRGTGSASVTADGCSNAELAPRQSCTVTLRVGPPSPTIVLASAQLAGTGAGYQIQVSANTGGIDDVPYTVTFSGWATLSDGSNTGAVADTSGDPALPAGRGGGCTVLAGEGPGDATLALLALGLLAWRSVRRAQAKP